MMSELSQKLIIFLVVGVLFLAILVIALVTLSKSAPEMLAKIIENTKTLFGSFFNAQ